MRTSRFITIALLILQSSLCFSQPTREWIRNYNGTGSGHDWAGPMTLDASGNIYCTGQSFGSNLRQDIVTLKYNSSGVQLWQHRFNRSTSHDCSVTSIAVDNSGNVYVGGLTGLGTYGSQDYFLIKYNSAGVLQWSRYYNGPANSNDELNSLVLDANGNIYVTGQSYGLEGATGNLDYFTMKYNPAGDTLWTKRANFGYYNSEHDWAYSIAIDQTGNVYVTGEATIYPGDGVIATVKYNSSGTEQWSKIYNGPGGPEGRIIKVDANNNIYVAGATGYGSSYNYITIKMNSNGDTLWTKQYNGTGNDEDQIWDMTLDISGNVIVTGKSKGSGNNFDYTTVKYSPSGSEMWVQRYNGAQNDVDEAYSIFADSSLNIYVAGKSNEGPPTGYDMTMIKYSPGGSPLWIVKADTLGGYGYATEIRAFGSNTVYLYGSQNGFGGSTNNDFVLMKYGQPIVSDTCFVRTTSCSQNYNYGFAEMKTDASGNVYAVGTCHQQNPTNTYIYTVKYNSSGVLQWSQIFDTAYIDKGNSIDIDANGNVYICGLSYIYGYLDFYYVTIKYSSSGQRLWTRVGPSLTGITAKIRVDSSGNVIVTGRSDDMGGDIRTVKYDTNGNLLWVREWNGANNDVDEPLDMVVDNSNNIIITGDTKDSGPFNIMDYFTLKYNSSGVLQWAQTYNRYSENSLGVAVDRLDNVYVTGNSSLSNSPTDIVTIKYNYSGVQQWVQLYNGPSNNYDGVGGIAVDTLGDVFITGARLNNSAPTEAITIKYNTSGVQQWLQAYKYNDSSSNNMSISLDRQGNVYTSGLTTTNLITSKYNPAGALVWQKAVTGNFYYVRKNIGNDYYGNVYIANLNIVSQGINNLLVYKYCQDIPVGITQTNTEIPHGFLLYQNYPNPFNPVTKIQFSVPSSQFVVIKIFDVTGREIATLINGQLKPGTYEVDFNGSNFASGIYFYRLETENYSDTKKMVLMK